MDKQPILEAITNIQTLEDVSSWDLQTILADFPFFHTAHLMWAKKSMDADSYEVEEIIQKAAIYAGNRGVLYKLLHQKAADLDPNLHLDTLQMDKKNLPIIVEQAEIDEFETEVVSIEDLDLPIEEEISAITEGKDSLGFLEGSTDGLVDGTEGIAVEDVKEMVSKETEEREELAVLEKLKEEIADKQKSIELQLEEEISSEGLEKENFIEETTAYPAAMDEKMEDTARSITSSIDKSLLKIAQEDTIEVEDKEVSIIPATMEVLQDDTDEDDKFALKHIFDKEDKVDEDDYLNTEQISDKARKQVESELSARLEKLEGNTVTPTLDSSYTADLSDLVKKELGESVQKDIEELQGSIDTDFEEEEDMRVNSAIIRASIEEDKAALKESISDVHNEVFLDDDEEYEEGVHPENEIESDLIMSLKAKVESYKQKKKTFESWLTGDSKQEEQPKVKLSEEDESEIKKFVDFQSEMKETDTVDTPSMTNETLLEGTESMAKVYAQQGHYERAVKIYEQLSLKYPEKSGYFVGKIVELQKKL
ncbi:MAG: hypothetical protein AB8B69_10750 [Chitinophagales bacterium]